MSDNPLSGISIPSLVDVADEVVGRMGEGTIDLRNPMQRQRLKRFIEQAIDSALKFKLEHALEKATARAIDHVFQVMRDADYQEKRRKRAAERVKIREEKRKRADAAAREARMDYSKRAIKPAKGPTIQ